MIPNSNPDYPIFDNVHGFIYVDSLELSIINSPFFQRLRDIRQLGLVEYVFPGANHNRFNHSLGVMHLADKMARSILSKQEKRHDELLLEIKKIRLAALLHDIGHYPWSHTVEHVVRKNADKKRIPFFSSNETPGKTTISPELEGRSPVNPPDEHTIPCNTHTLNCRLNGEGDYANHEKIASIVIYNTEIYDLLHNNGISDPDIDSICKIISGQYTEGLEGSLIHSELDADRFDYLLRDSYYSGVSYGQFDVEQIIRYLDINTSDDITSQQSSYLVVNKKGQRAVEDFLIARYFLYSTVIYHKANISFNEIAERTYYGLMERGCVPSYVEILEMFETGSRDDYCHPYLDYTDTKLTTLLRGIHSKKIDLPEKSDAVIPDAILRELIEKIVQRKPLKQIFEYPILTNRTNIQIFEDFWKKELSEKKQKFESAGLDMNWLIETHISTSITSIKPYISISDGYGSSNPDEAIRIYDPKRIEQPISLLSDDKSSIIQALSDKDLIIRGLYTKDDNYKQMLNL